MVINMLLLLSLVDVCIKDDSSMGETTPETTVNATSTTILINRIISTTTLPKFNITTASSTIQSSRISQPSTTSSFSSNSTTSVSTTSTKPMNITSKPTISSSTFKLTTLMTTTTTLRTTQKLTSSTTSKALTIPQIPQQSNDTMENKNDEMQNKTIKKTDYDEVIPNIDNEIEDEHEMFMTTSAVEKLPIQKMQSAKRNENLSFIITTVVIAVSCSILAFIAIFIVYKQYRKSTNPLNYKEKSENGTKRADEEFSEIRYLTSDEEALDFTLASPTSVTDL